MRSALFNYNLITNDILIKYKNMLIEIILQEIVIFEGKEILFVLFNFSAKSVLFTY